MPNLVWELLALFAVSVLTSFGGQCFAQSGQPEKRVAGIALGTLLIVGGFAAAYFIDQRHSIGDFVVWPIVAIISIYTGYKARAR